MDVLLGTGTRLAAAVAVLAVSLALAGPAGAASPIGPDGSIHGCYVAKGKKKGQMRLLPTGKKCKKKKKEKPIAWSVQGPQGAPGAAGAQGDQGPQGQSGISSEQLSTLTERINQQDATIQTLNATVTGLTTTVGTLTAVLDGVTNGGLTAVIDALDGIDNADLTGALADITALCARASEQTTFGNSLLSSVGGLTVGGIGALFVPGLPAALSAFAC